VPGYARALAGNVHEDFRRVPSPFDGVLVRLRAFEEDDIPRVNELVWDPDVSRFLAMAWPESVAGTRAFWERTRAGAESEGPTFVIERMSGNLVGLCGFFDLSRRNRTVELGIWISKEFWDEGYGTDAVRTLCRFGFREMNLQRIGLSVYELNLRAVRAYEKAGFKEEGRARRAHFMDGKYSDVIRMGLLAEDLIEGEGD
jgi:RimJ/RimL family protein N-acetyltransferase